MLNTLSFSLKETYLKNQLRFLELTFLSLFLVFLPSLEAPKNIFLASYLGVAIYRQFKFGFQKWDLWDWTFLLLVISALLSAMFAGIPGGAEWKGFRGFLLWIVFGFVLSRGDYNIKEKIYLFALTILATLPPLIWGLMQFFLGIKDSIELHSVGHVNHSAIYLCMIFGASYGISQFYILKKDLFRNFFLVLLPISLFISIILSESRGALGIAFLTFLSFILLSKINLKERFFQILPYVLILILTITFSAPIIEKHISDQKQNIVLANRDKAWLAAIEVARVYPIFGIGSGNWSHIKIDQIKSAIESRGEVFDPEKYAFNFGHPHNIYFSNLAERGILGLIIFLNFLVIWLITLVNSYKNALKSPEAFLLFSGSLSAFAAIFGIGLVNTTFHHENALLALFFLSLHLNYLRQKNQLKLFS
jgi:O-antigen ligase